MTQDGDSGEAAAEKPPAVPEDAPTATKDPPAATGDPTDVMGRRILAFVIDAAIGTAVVVAVSLGVVFAQVEVRAMDSNAAAIAECERIAGEGLHCDVVDQAIWVSDDFDSTGSVYPLVAWLLMVVVLTMVLPGITGWSLGKLAMGLRIVDMDSYVHAGLRPNLCRGAYWVVDAAPYVFPLIGILSASSSAGHQRIGDRSARTLVVDKASVGRPPKITALPAIPGTGADRLPGTSPGDEDAESMPGVGSPHWDDARGTHIQWDPELEEWMEWSATQERWIPISR